MNKILLIFIVLGSVILLLRIINIIPSNRANIEPDQINIEPDTIAVDNKVIDDCTCSILSEKELLSVKRKEYAISTEIYCNSVINGHEERTLEYWKRDIYNFKLNADSIKLIEYKKAVTYAKDSLKFCKIIIE